MRRGQTRFSWAAVDVFSLFFFSPSSHGRVAQNERAYLKQPGVFEYGKHRRGVATSKRERTTRHVHKTALGFKTPKMAIEGKYIDRKCPWVGNVSIRGRILKGRVLSTKMNKTLILRRDSLHYVKKYQRYEKRHANTAAHVSPAFMVKEGDVVTVGECRPLAKTVKFNVLQVEPRTTAFLQAKKRFQLF